MICPVWVARSKIYASTSSNRRERRTAPGGRSRHLLFPRLRPAGSAQAPPEERQAPWFLPSKGCIPGGALPTVAAPDQPHLTDVVLCHLPLPSRPAAAHAAGPGAAQHPAPGLIRQRRSVQGTGNAYRLQPLFIVLGAFHWLIPTVPVVFCFVPGLSYRQSKRPATSPAVSTDRRDSTGIWCATHRIIYDAGNQVPAPVPDPRRRTPSKVPTLSNGGSRGESQLLARQRPVEQRPGV